MVQLLITHCVNALPFSWSRFVIYNIDNTIRWSSLKIANSQQKPFENIFHRRLVSFLKNNSQASVLQLEGRAHFLYTIYDNRSTFWEVYLFTVSQRVRSKDRQHSHVQAVTTVQPVSLAQHKEWMHGEMISLTRSKGNKICLYQHKEKSIIYIFQRCTSLFSSNRMR